MRAKYKRTLFFIGVLIVMCGFVGVAYLFYDKVLSPETDVVVVEELSVNFIDGFKVNREGAFNFSVTNNGDKDIYYEIRYNELLGYQHNIKYSLVSQDASINISNATIDKDNNNLAVGILIPSRATQSFTFNVSGNTIASFNIEIRKVMDTDKYFYTTILSNNKVKKSSVTKVGEEIAETDEGLIEDIDDLGLTYYFRGNVQNNYVKIAESLWRIIRINGDGTVKLVLDENVSELANYHSDIENFESLKDASISTYLANYYESNLTEYDDYIINYKYCIETESISNTNEKLYNGYTRLVTNKIPTFNCLGSLHSSKIGLLTADEVIYAGANFEKENKSYYLYNSKIENVWWTSSLAKASATVFYPFSVNSNGKVEYATSGMLYRNLRPTINLIRKTVVSGNGTKDNPYEIKI